MPFTGDNPATILSLPLREKDAIISLGTSTTLLMSTAQYLPSPKYHIFAHPTTPGLYMAMLCYKNGSLAREEIRDSVNELYPGMDRGDWTYFNQLVLRYGAPRTNTKVHKIGLYYSLPEIIPHTSKGVHRLLVSANGEIQRIDPAVDALGVVDGPSGSSKWEIPEDDPRAILESQFLDIRMRAQGLFDGQNRDPNDMNKQPGRTYLVGGASSNIAVTKGTLFANRFPRLMI